MEFVWLIIAVLTTIYGFYIYKIGRAEESVLPFVLPLVAFGMFALRRFHRKKLEKMEQSKSNS